MPFKFKSTVDKRGSFLLLTKFFGFCLYRGNYRILPSLVTFRKETGNSATISARVWTFLIFLNFRCWTAFKYCSSVPFAHFLPWYFTLYCCDNPGEENHQSEHLNLKSTTDGRQEDLQRTAMDQTPWLWVPTVQRVVHMPNLQQHSSSNIPS